MFSSLKSFWAAAETQTARQALKKIAKQNPKKILLDAATLLGTAKCFESHSIISNPTLNQLGLHRYRVKKAAEMAALRRQRLAHFLTVEEVEQFEQNGFILKENFLAEDVFDALSKELLETPLDTRETLQGDTVTRRMALDGQILKTLPHTKRLLESKHWQAMLNYVNSSKVQPMYYVQVIISHVRQARPDPQTKLHSDTFHANMKAWLFLTDVAEDEGPFVYVPGSHIANEKRLDWEHKKATHMTAKADAMTRRGSFRVHAKELAGLGYAEPKAFAVKKNTVVIADTYGFHARGPSTRPSMRIELWAYGRRSPFLPWTGLHPLALPYLKHHLVPWYWQSLDLLEKYTHRKNPWRKVGKLTASAPAVIKQK